MLSFFRGRSQILSLQWLLAWSSIVTLNPRVPCSSAEFRIVDALQSFKRILPSLVEDTLSGLMSRWNSWLLLRADSTFSKIWRKWDPCIVPHVHSSPWFPSGDNKMADVKVPHSLLLLTYNGFDLWYSRSILQWLQCPLFRFKRIYLTTTVWPS